MAVTVSVYLWKTRALKNGKYPIKMRVCEYGRRNKCTYHTITYNNFKLALSVEDWERLDSRYLKDPMLRHIRTFLEAEEERARKIVESLRPFTFAGFKRLWDNKPQAGTLAELFEEKIKETNNVGTKNNYRSTLKKIQQFDSRTLLPQDITSSWLRRFEKFVTKTGSITSVGVYCRPLRAILNTAIDDGIIDKSQMPFGKGVTKYQIPAGKTRKRPLSLTDLKKLFAYEPDPNQKGKYFTIHYFQLSYLLYGINPADLFRLTKDHIKGDQIVFVRHKTRNTKQNTTPITVEYTPQIKALFSKIGPKDPDNPYLIDLLRPGMTEDEETRKIKSKNSLANRRIKDIAEEVGIENHKKIIFYSARDTVATISRDEGYTADQIAAMLGNSSRIVDKHYFGEMSKELRREMQSKLLPGEGHRASDE